jgi:hypothetical protein
MTARIETTGKKEVRQDATRRVHQTTLRMMALRMMMRRHSLTDMEQTADLADGQIAAQGRIAERDRSTLPALRAAAAEAERVCDAAVALVKAARDAAVAINVPVVAQIESWPVVAAKLRKVVVEKTTVVYGAGERVQVLMVTYPTYRYDVIVDGSIVYQIKATRNWRAERKVAIAEAVAAV